MKFQEWAERYHSNFNAQHGCTMPCHMGLALAKEHNYSLCLNTSIYADPASSKLWNDIGRLLKRACKKSEIHVKVTEITGGNKITR